MRVIQNTHIDIFLKPVFVDRLGDWNGATLHRPAEHKLSGANSLSLCCGLDVWIVEKELGVSRINPDQKTKTVCAQPDKPS